MLTLTINLMILATTTLGSHTENDIEELRQDQIRLEMDIKKERIERELYGY